MSLDQVAANLEWLGQAQMPLGPTLSAQNLGATPSNIVYTPNAPFAVAWCPSDCSAWIIHKETNIAQNVNPMTAHRLQIKQILQVMKARIDAPDYFRDKGEFVKLTDDGYFIGLRQMDQDIEECIEWAKKMQCKKSGVEVDKGGIVILAKLTWGPPGDLFGGKYHLVVCKILVGDIYSRGAWSTNNIAP
jgi:hypothetical protein